MKLLHQCPMLFSAFRPSNDLTVELLPDAAVAAGGKLRAGSLDAYGAIVNPMYLGDGRNVLSIGFLVITGFAA
jgi:hypothetical protein